ncbi:FAD-binding oxidoreductase [Enhygromyxa salina]|uniref:Putative FAD-linked oxidoreductase n=1 Tax=Enhygromyxa salina TaxID=215803 RepID=A0A2S9YVL7_9BACT|nr:FAD-linked oxidase C-terminal domain-containing protein [Enhygromyxa salina]PRQ09092.1 putative FAD-linked oxidoreductase [Enhygromyxa salina]
MSTVVQLLEAELPDTELSTDADVAQTYAADQAGFCPAGRAAAVVRARSVHSVQTVMRIASATGTPVVPRGAGTGLSGGANAVDGCIVLCLEKMDRILELDPSSRLARVEPGVLNGSLDRAARAYGLMYAPDPASRDISTIGGNVATNAGGACCLKYGVTRDHIARLVAVLADGSLIRTGSDTLKNVAGLDLTSLLVGSEGTLAVVVEVCARLMPARPACGTMVAQFADLAAAGRAVVELAGPRNLSKLEIMDRTTVRAVEAIANMDLDTSAAALLLAQADTVDAPAIMAASEATCERLGATFVATTLDETEGELFMRARAMALPALEKQGHCLLDDVAVTIPRVPDLLELCAAIAERHRVTVGTFGHAGDGNLHPTIVYDAHDPAQAAAALAAFDDIIAGTLKLGGSVTGEHGVGMLKRPHLARMLGERELALMRGIKGVFDPRGILNPGKGY